MWYADQFAAMKTGSENVLAVDSFGRIRKRKEEMECSGDAMSDQNKHDSFDGEEDSANSVAFDGYKNRLDFCRRLP